MDSPPRDMLHIGDCLPWLRSLPDACATLAVVDGPYNMRKAVWDTFPPWGAFVDWYRPLMAELARVLRDNSSFYLFGTFAGLAALKPMLDELDGFCFRQACVWDKGMASIAGRTAPTLRMHPVRLEHIVFYARERVDISSLAWDGVTREDNSLRAYLNAERERAGFTVADVAEAWRAKTGARVPSGLASHWFGCSQWMLPTRENYLWLRDLFNRVGGDAHLRREYAHLRYPFNPQQGMTDVWDFNTCAGAERVKTEGGQTAHVAQKPLALIETIIRASSNEGDVVIDPMAGLGTTAVACVRTGRRFLACELSPEYHAIAETRIARACGQAGAERPSPASVPRTLHTPRPAAAPSSQHALVFA